VQSIPLCVQTCPAQFETTPASSETSPACLRPNRRDLRPARCVRFVGEWGQELIAALAMPAVLHVIFPRFKPAGCAPRGPVYSSRVSRRRLACRQVNLPKGSSQGEWIVRRSARQYIWVVATFLWPSNSWTVQPRAERQPETASRRLPTGRELGQRTANVPAPHLTVKSVCCNSTDESHPVNRPILQPPPSRPT